MESNVCRFEYLYRDAGNYKAWGELFLSGAWDEMAASRIRRCLEADMLFIPEAVGIPSLREQLFIYSDGPTSDDHCYHEFVGVRPAGPSEDTLVFGSLDELVERFEKARSLFLLKVE